MAQPIWNTAAGSLGNFPFQYPISVQLSASALTPATTITYTLLSGSLPIGLTLSSSGLISGTPTFISELETANFAVRATDNLNNLTDRTFSMTVSGSAIPYFTTPTGGLFTTNDSLWIEYQIGYTVPIADTPTVVRVTDGELPPGLEINEVGIIRGYPEPPVNGFDDPIVQTYYFTLQLYSEYGGKSNSYSITVVNQHTPISAGGPGYADNTRVPTILNTRPLTFIISPTDPYYAYYLVPPPESATLTTAPSANAFIGTLQSGNQFTFKINGYDFDDNTLSYNFSGLPAGLSGDSTTGWVTGTPNIASPGLSSYSFSVATYKTANSSIQSVFFNFSYYVSNDISPIITWVTPTDLGTIYNGTVSTKKVSALADAALVYTITSGALPPNLTLSTTGEIIGTVADQPTNTLLAIGDSTEFTFTIRAQSPTYPIITATKTFVLTVYQKFDQPTDTLYIKAMPSVQDRNIINLLLQNDTLIPPDYIYRIEDPNFGKASSVIYEHAYGIFASNIQQYLAAITRNHYWRFLTLGQIKTAVATDEYGDPLYEVVYSEIIDNLVNPQGVSVSNRIYWPRPIRLNGGGFARILYPNSLVDMRTRVANVLGQTNEGALLPLWMTTQQPDGSILGYTQAWVICYTKPGYASEIVSNIERFYPYILNQITFEIDRFSVNKSITYDYDTTVTPNVWTALPSATPTPTPLDSEDFYALFPRKTIIPDEPQY
jgi:Putative Ig domain